MKAKSVSRNDLAGWWSRWALVAIFACGMLLALHSDTTNGTVGVKVVFEYARSFEPDGKHRITKVVAWRDGMTAAGAIMAAGGYQSPYIRKGKVIRGSAEIPLDLKRMVMTGEGDVRIQAEDAVLLY